MEERIQKLIAQAGIASRRAAEVMISEGRVLINGEVAKLGQKADLSRDVIKVDDRFLPRAERMRYLAFHKPRGILSSTEPQPQTDLKTIMDLVEIDARVYPVGRLDVNSEGLVLLTNDGELTNLITHPRYGHEKTYKVQVEGCPTPETLTRWQKGVTLPDGFHTAPCKVYVLEQDRNATWVRVVMREGHKRQIREIGDLLGHPILRLIRTHIGPLALGDLLPGKWRELSEEEVENLWKEAKAKSRPRSPGKKHNQSRGNN